MLTLPIKKKWFDMIVSGEKKEEYREIKPYWNKRFKNALYNLTITSYFGSFYALGTIRFKNGYQKNAPKIECYIELTRGTGKPEWGAKPGKEYYVLKILSVEEVK